MNTFFILYFRENNGNGEYVVFTDPDVSDNEIEDYQNFGWHFESKIVVETNDKVHNLPFERNLMKQD